ncbi:MAG: hypothetical protein ABIJ18_02870 [archaeon]
MGKKQIKKDSRISVKKKRWYSIQAPKVLNNVIVGETPAADPALLEGRIITINLHTVTRNIKKQNTEVKFKIKEIKGNECLTDFIGYEIVSAYVKRLVKRSKCRVDDSFIAETKDNKQVRIKPLVLTRDKAQKGILSALRKSSKEYLTKKLKEMDYNEFLSKLMLGEIQKEMKGELKKVYPLSIAEVRALRLIVNKK